MLYLAVGSQILFHRKQRRTLGGSLALPSLIEDGRRFHLKSRAALKRAGTLLGDAAVPGEGAPQFRQILEHACDRIAFK
jgi:hypothetical protein